MTFGRQTVQLTHLDKPFFPQLKLTKGDLLQYYLDISPYVLPHVRDRAMVMKRYPNGADGPYFYMKRAPSPHPAWLETCSIPHPQAGLVDYPLIRDEASLLWIVNLGCIDLHPWYSECGDYNRPDFLHFDLDPVPGATFATVRQAALLLREYLGELGVDCFAKTTGSRGIHAYVPIQHGPAQKEVWTVAKEIARALERRAPQIVTAEYRKIKRPRGRVLVDYNQNAWGKTLASAYSVRANSRAMVSAPVTWQEISDGVELEDFTILNMVKRAQKLGDLWKPLLSQRAQDRVALARIREALGNRAKRRGRGALVARKAA